MHIQHTQGLQTLHNSCCNWLCSYEHAMLLLPLRLLLTCPLLQLRSCIANQD